MGLRLNMEFSGIYHPSELQIAYRNALYFRVLGRSNPAISVFPASPESRVSAHSSKFGAPGRTRTYN